MKKFIIFAIASLISVASYCLNEAKTQMFKHRAVKLLQTSATHLIVRGDVSPDEKLTDILQALKVSVDYSLSCVENSSAISKCTLFIAHHPVGETAVIFEVRLDEKEMPKRIMGDVEISRGD